MIVFPKCIFTFIPSWFFTSVYCQCFLDTLYVGCYKWKRLKKKDLGVVVQCFIARMKDGFRKEDLSIDEIGESTSNNKVSFIHFLPRGKPSSAVQMQMNIIKIVKKILPPKYWYCNRIALIFLRHVLLFWILIVFTCSKKTLEVVKLHRSPFLWCILWSRITLPYGMLFGTK